MTVIVKKNVPSGTIVLNRPDKRNALSRQMLTDLSQALDDLHQERKVRAVILTGAGTAFCAGMDLAEIASKMGLSPQKTVEALLPAGAIYFSMDEKDVQRILGFEHTMIGSDGLPHDAAPHPRLWGTFPRVLGFYSRSIGLFPLEKAVYKMTGLTAKTFGLAGRGVLKPGYAADLVLFDAGEVDEAASFAKPIQAAKGIDTVFVNGEAVWRGGKPTGARPGRVLGRTAT